MKRYDRVFVTHLPAFYKVNLYKQIAKHSRICVIFIASGSVHRSQNFSKHLDTVSHYILHHGDLESRPRLKNLKAMYQLIRQIKAREWIVGGWDLPEYWLCAFLHPKLQNAAAVESTYIPAPAWKMWIKKRFVARLSRVYASGAAQLSLLDRLGFSGQARITGGVGLLDWMSVNVVRSYAKRFIFVGRFSPEKNLNLLLAAFRQCPTASLTLVGEGPLEPALRAGASDNVTFMPYQPHEGLPSLLMKHDVLILPSSREAWGLVVEEAQYCGLPVIVSSVVGCAAERVEQTQAGIVFDKGSLQGLIDAIVQMQTPKCYQQFLKQVGKIDFDRIRNQQVNSYLDEATTDS